MFAFDGKLKSCVKFRKVKGGVLRCAEFEKGKKYPSCPGSGLKGGGRSQEYLRPGKKCVAAGKIKKAKKRSGGKKSKRSSRKSRR